MIYLSEVCFNICKSYHGDENFVKRRIILFITSLTKDSVFRISFSRGNNNREFYVFVPIFVSLIQPCKTKRIKIFNHEMFSRTFNAVVSEILRLK